MSDLKSIIKFNIETLRRTATQMNITNRQELGDRYTQAADDIERLQAELEAFKEAVPQKEVERLRAELEKVKEQLRMPHPVGEVSFTLGALQDENERLREALDDAFLAGWDHYNASRSRMDMPRDRIKCLEYWKEKEALKQ